MVRIGKGESFPVGVGVVVAVVGRTPSDCPLVAIVGLDILLLDVTVLAMCASAVIRNIETDQLF